MCARQTECVLLDLFIIFHVGCVGFSSSFLRLKNGNSFCFNLRGGGYCPYQKGR